MCIRDRVKALQWMLTHSFYAKALAVKRVTSNKGSAMLGLAASFSISTSIPLLMLARRDSSSSDIFFALR